MVKDRKIYGFFKGNINLLIVIFLFIVLCVSYILIIPVFEAPDEPGHFIYAFYISKYNKLPSTYNEPIKAEQYIKENIDEKANKVLYMDNKYMFYKEPQPSQDLKNYRDQRHHPPIYYLISSQIIKPFNVHDIYIEDNLNMEHGIYNKYTDNKILKYNSPTISLVLILRLFQIVYGVLSIFFIFKIIKLLSDDEFKSNSVLLVSVIAFLPQFVFLCSYINNDVLSSLFGLISAYFMMLLFKRDKAYFGLVSILFAIIGGFTKYTILIMLPITIIAFFIWFVIKKKKVGAILAISAIIVLSIVTFYYIINFGESKRMSSALIDRVLRVSNKFFERLKYSEYRLINMPQLTNVFKSTVAVFGWMQFYVESFIYYFFLAYVISGILVFFTNIKDYINSKKSIIFIILSIISLFSYFLIYTASTGWAQNQGRVLLLAVFLTYILAILGLKSIKDSNNNIFYYGLFTSSLLISVFCLYKNIYFYYY
jgi:hypothetical protein